MIEKSNKSYKECLEEMEEIIVHTRGMSMRPFIVSGRDAVIIKRYSGEKLKKYDIVLFFRPPSSYVLHRVVEVRENDYVFLGDNCINKEYGIKDENIIGVLTEIIKPNSVVRADASWMKLCGRLWYYCYPLRRLVKIAKSKVVGLGRKLI